MSSPSATSDLVTATPQAVRLRAENSDVQNGAVQMAIHDGDMLRKGLYHTLDHPLDLPGDRRNVPSLSLRCRATDARGVTIKIFTSK